MSPQLNFYRERAAEAGRDAGNAKLDNVRERCLRAEEAWLGMAARVERSEKLRADSIAHKTGAGSALLIGDPTMIPDDDEIADAGRGELVD